MADTRYLTKEVEDFVRLRLRQLHGTEFSKRKLSLTTGGKHEFDAVSTDGDIVASIKATSGRTSGGNLPQGKFNNAIAELYYLNLVKAPTRILVLTNADFRGLLVRKLQGAIAPGVSIEYIPLSVEIQAEVDKVVRAASDEMSRQAAAEIVAEAEIT